MRRGRLHARRLHAAVRRRAIECASPSCSNKNFLHWPTQRARHVGPATDPDNEVRPPVADAQEPGKLRTKSGYLDRLVDECDAQAQSGGLERKALAAAAR